LFTRLNEYLVNDDDLYVRLVQPLRVIQITNNIAIHADDLPATDEGQPLLEKLIPENADWAPGW
jgi:hypothetical protein